MADGWDDAVRFVDGVSALAERLVAEEVRLEIDGAWPELTGWSRANNRVRLGQSSDFPLEPPFRPDDARSWLLSHNGNVSAAARAAGLPRTSFRKLLGQRGPSGERGANGAGTSD